MNDAPLLLMLLIIGTFGIKGVIGGLAFERGDIKPESKKNYLKYGNTNPYTRRLYRLRETWLLSGIGLLVIAFSFLIDVYVFGNSFYDEFNGFPFHAFIIGVILVLIGGIRGIFKYMWAPKWAKDKRNNSENNKL